MKIKLRSFDTVIYTEEHTQEVRYLYSIEDSTGILEIDLTIPEEADPVEQFILHIKDIYRGIYEYVIYHTKYKYRYTKHKTVNGEEWFIVKTKMW